MSGKTKSLRFALIAFLLAIVANLSAQTVKCTVIDNTGEPVIGASILEVGTNRGGN